MPASLPSDQMITLGWFLSRSTVRSDPVEIDLGEPRVVARVADPALELEAVGLDVALVDHPEAQLVEHRQDLRVRRVVAGADGVDAVPLHQQQVVAGVRRVVHPAELRMGLVPVHPAERDRRAVDQQLRVRDLHRAEPDPEPDLLAGGRDDGLVQPRGLGRPRIDRPDVEQLGLTRAVEGGREVELGDLDR